MPGCLFFRIYENNAPIAENEFLQWSTSGPLVDEPLFVLGHPGKTERGLTSSHLGFIQKHKIPLILSFLQEKISKLEALQQISDENKRITENILHSLKNSQKVFLASYASLKDDAIIQAKKKSEKTLFASIDNKPWNDLEQALQNLEKYHAEYFALEVLSGNFWKYYAWAQHIVRGAQEKTKPNEARLAEYRESELKPSSLVFFQQSQCIPH